MIRYNENFIFPLDFDLFGTTTTAGVNNNAGGGGMGGGNNNNMMFNRSASPNSMAGGPARLELLRYEKKIFVNR